MKNAKDVVSHCIRSFKEHPAEAGETYGQHLWFTLCMSLRLIAVAISLFIHGLLPFLFRRTASSQSQEIHRIFQIRIDTVMKNSCKGRENN
jgi:hypothetical protein